MTTQTMNEINGDLEALWPSAVTLRAAGVAVVLGLPQDALPFVIHWGGDIGAQDADSLRELALHAQPPLATNGVDVPVIVGVVPENAAGWTGTPGLQGHRSGQAWSTRFVPVSVDISDDAPSGGSVSVRAVDVDAQLSLGLLLELLPSGLLRLSATLRNDGVDSYTIDALDLALPVPTRADVVFDMAGRWAKERVAQSRPFTVGTHLREGRHGRTGADAATFLAAGTADLDFGQGEVWGLHVAFSGNHRVLAERAFSGERLILGGELLLPGEIQLAPGETYETPALFAGYGAGLDAVAARFHAHLRSRPSHPRSARPVVMNVWEAVYFDHELPRLLELADAAERVGVERFVLDDGWFGSRRDDTSGLGDWVIAEDVWGGGRFRALVEGVKRRGMQFGLWFEPEMVNVTSDLATAHPEWLLQVPGRLPVDFRHQQVLDLSHPGAFAHVFDQIVSLVREHGIDYIKWDHNRDLIEAGSTRTGRAGVHEQTLATYRLLDAIRRACPGLEIESCSSGGARVDLGILEHTDRVWASDCIDARERQQIQRWTAQLLPPELVGSHVGADRAHTTRRRIDLDFRAATALFGHFGIEWDLTTVSPDDLQRLTAWVAYYKGVRGLIHSGTTVRRELEGGDLWLHGSVSPHRDRALYAVILRERHVTWPVGRVRLPGLDPDREYRVRVGGPGPLPAYDPRIHPSWYRSGISLSGAVLQEIGVHVAALDPDTSVLLDVEVVR
ncbi:MULTISPECIES: alpha-galactosidase [Microbacterium]|uniref:Alpha-galactosidase n=1 Tax=Microbacterium testaceum TaxID=2033 RepID=A0A4Y3QLT7_MICTE|nr:MULTISPECIES: alpha-galactosidase [Microbacterium]MDZ5144997.1 alpha-galactosidase [Microbacterium testaceum]GEB45899.1 alpha-galactosidase [Microbacterium testaceum]